MSRFLLLAAFVVLFASPIVAQDKDGDGISDEIEMRLGMDPEQPDPLVLLCDDKSKAEGDKTIGPKQEKAYDMTKIYFGSVAEDRYLWRLDFAAAPALDKDIALILYMDVDNNKDTGRKDSEWAKGVDIMLRPGAMNTYEYDATAAPKPWTTYVVDGNSLYMVADLRIHQEGGKSVYRAYLLSQYMQQVDGRHDDNDRTDWMTVSGPGRSSRKRIEAPGVKAAGVVSLQLRRVDRRNIEKDPANAIVKAKEYELNGFEFDPKYEVVSGGSVSGSTISFPCPVDGSYRLGFTLCDDADGSEDMTILVDGKPIGRAVADQNDNGIYFFETEKPCDFRKGQKITLRTGQPVGYYRVENAVFLKELLRPYPFEITDVFADTNLPDERGPAARITWITTLAASSALEYGKQGGDMKTVTDDVPRNNHRVVLRDLDPGAAYEFTIRADDGKGRKAETKKLSFSAKPVPLPPGAAKRKTVTLTVRGPENVGLTAWPVASGVPIPEGDLASVENVRVLGPDGKEIPCQVELLGRWINRSVKWALVLFDADAPAGGKADYTVEYGTDVKQGAFPSPLSVSDSATELTVNTGPMKFTIDKNCAGLLGSVWIDRNRDGRFADDELLSGGDKPSSACLTDKDGKVFTSLAKPTNVVVEENGPRRAAVRIEGDYTSGDGSTFYTYIVRIHAYAGKGFVRVFYTFGNNVVGSMFSYVKDLSLKVPLRLEGKRLCAMDIDGKTIAPDLAQTATVRLFQNFDDKCTVYENGQPAQEGKRAAGWASLGDGTSGAVAAVKDFWQMYPKDFAVTSEEISIGILPALGEHDYDDLKPLHHRLYFHLLNGVYKLCAGLAKRHEILLDFAPAQEQDKARLNAAAFQATIFPAAPPQWYCDSKAFGDIIPAKEGEFDDYETMVSTGFEGLEKRQVDLKEYGWHNFGDWYGERGYNWGNIEYDTQAGLFMQFARTGNLDYFRHAVESSRHNMDIDTIHYAANPGDVGKVHVHCLCHTGGYYGSKEFEGAIASGGYNRGHVWNRGLFLDYFLTGDRRAGEVARSVSECIARELTTNFAVGNHAERDTAWPLIGSMTAYEATGDRFFLNSAKIMVTDVLREQDPKAGNWQFPAGYSKVVPPPIGGYAWCCGLLIKALQMYYAHTPDEQVKTCITRAADWLVREEWIPEKNGLRATSCPTFNETTRPGGSCWSCGPGLVAAYRMSGDKRFLDIGLKGYCYSLRGSGMGKSYSQYICFSPNLIYDLKQLGVTDVSTERYEPPFTARAGGTPVIVKGETPVVSVAITGNRKKGIRGAAAIVDLPAGWKADADRKEFAIEKYMETREIAFTLQPGAELEPGKEYRVRVKVDAEGQTETLEFVVKAVTKASLGDKVGLIAGKEDFLGPALTKAGVAFDAIDDVASGLADYRLIFVGTQAHALDAAGISKGAARTWEYVKSGGMLVLSQMNDDNWRPDLLPGRIVLDEEDSQSGKIVDAASRLFSAKHRVADASGMKMYDGIAGLGPEWHVLLADERGRPAIAEARIGHGRMLLFEPSVERYYSGAMTAVDQTKNEEYRHLFENILAYAQSGGESAAPHDGASRRHAP